MPTARPRCRAWSALCGAGIWALLAAGCLDQRCFEDADCPSPKICSATGHCGFQCLTRGDCADGFNCVDRVCRPAAHGPISCPADMVAVADTFCIDRHEASRRDATARTPGSDETVAISAAGVMPWQVASNQAAATACAAAGKRLCEPAEWQLACTGPDNTVYGYGNAYQPATCNGIDTYGRDGFHLMPTGSFSGCTNEWGAFDLNGNLWEHVAGGSDQTVRGGAYNCSDSATYQRCDYVPRSWTPSARGFRCCLTPVLAADASVLDGVGLDRAALDAAREGGCIGDSGAADSAIDDGAITDGVSWDQSAHDAGRTDASGRDLVAPDTAGGDTAARDVSAPDAAAPDIAAADAAGHDAVSRDAAADGAVLDRAGADAAADCPADMAPVGSSCVDRYEASRSDSTASAAGTSTVASTRANVIPWFPVTLAQARAGCASMGKRLCRSDEWQGACEGPAATTYAYGDSYDPAICNGIDTFCNCQASACAGLAVCPYPHCYSRASATESGGPCGASFHVMPTGSFVGCSSGYGLFDINGNVWEVVDNADGVEHFRGGAFNCGDSELLHRCDYDATWNPSAKGFRCCRDRGR